MLITIKICIYIPISCKDWGKWYSDGNGFSSLKLCFVASLDIKASIVPLWTEACFLQCINSPKSVRFSSKYSLWMNTANFICILFTLAQNINCPLKKAKPSPQRRWRTQRKVVSGHHRNMNACFFFCLFHAAEKWGVRNWTVFSCCQPQYQTQVSEKQKYLKLESKWWKPEKRYKKTDFSTSVY